MRAVQEDGPDHALDGETVDAVLWVASMMRNFDDPIEKTIPEKGRVTTRTRGRNVSHGVNFEIQIRTLKELEVCQVYMHAITSLLTSAVSQGIGPDDIRMILERAHTASLDSDTKRWKFGDGET